MVKFLDFSSSSEMTPAKTNWVRINFFDSTVTFDVKREPRMTTPPLQQVGDDILISGIKTNLSNHPELVEIIINLVKTNNINRIVMRSDSVYLGSGILRYSVIFPSEVFLPTFHELENGTIIKSTKDGLVLYKGEQFLANIHLKIGVSSIDSDDIPIIQYFKSKRFVGFMDDNAVPSTSQPGQKK
nr:TPA_asm: M [Morinda alphacytorhabdovirus 1_Ile]